MSETNTLIDQMLLSGSQIEVNGVNVTRPEL